MCMMNRVLMAGLLLSSIVHAEPKPLPPVIDNSTYYAGVKSTTPSNNAIYEVLGRVEQLQAEVQQLRGVVEEQSHLIEQLKSRQSTIYTDLDSRLLELNNIVVQGGNVAMPVINAAHTAATQTPTQHPEVAQQQVVVAPVVPEVNQKQLYQDAYESLRNGHTNQAITALKSLLAQFPSGEYADNAHYWLGEAYKVKQDHKAAKQAFMQVVELFPNSQKVPDALLKLGYIELDLNNKTKARDYLTQVTVNYPQTTAAHLATKKLLQLDRP